MAGGVHKALLDWGGKALIQHQCDLLLHAGCDPVVVVTGHDGEAVARAVPDGCLVVHNAQWESGRSSSLELGAKTIDPDVEAVVVVAVDQPLSADVIGTLLGAGQHPLTIPRDPQGQTGHPVLLGAHVWPQLCAATVHPQGLRSIVAPLRPSAREVDVNAPVKWDLNTAEQYRAAHQTCFGR